MTFDTIYEFLRLGECIRRHGATLHQFHYDGKTIWKLRKRIHGGKASNDTVREQALFNGIDLMANDWEVVPKVERLNK